MPEKNKFSVIQIPNINSWSAERQIRSPKYDEKRVSFEDKSMKNKKEGTSNPFGKVAFCSVCTTDVPVGAFSAAIDANQLEFPTSKI